MKILIITSKTGETKGMYKITPAHVKKILSQNPNLKVDLGAETDPDISTKLATADVLITSEFGMLNKENAKNLKWIHLTSAGANKLPDFIKNSDTVITNSSGVHPVPITEHVFAFILMLSRKIHLAARIQVEKKKWSRSFEYYNPEEIMGKNLLIVGMGRIGEQIAKIGEVFGMNVSGVVRDLSKKRNIKVKLYSEKDLKKAVKDADFIVNALPGTEHTKGIFDLSLFKNFKPTAYFINIGRGTSVVEKDLIKALKSGTIAGAGLDVFEVEPLPDSSPLWDLENVIITPHYSGWNPNYTDRVIEIFIENLKAYFKKSPLPNLIDKKLGY